MPETRELFIFNNTAYQLSYETTEASTINYRLVKSAFEGQDSPTLNQLPPHLKEGELVVIDSIKSGVGRENKDLYGHVLKEILNDLKVSHQYIKTDSASSIIEFGASLKAGKNYTIALLSGDTSIFELVNAIQNNNQVNGSIKTALFPLGSGNSISHSTGISDEVEAIQNFFLNFSIKKLPVYKAVFPEGSVEILNGVTKPVKELHFICCLSSGIHAQLVYEAERPELKHLGVERFKIAANKVLTAPSISYKSQLLDAQTHERIIDTDNFNYLILSAVKYLEKNYAISPESQMANNELHTVAFVGFDHASMGASLLLPYQNGAHLKDDKVSYSSFKKAIIYKLGDETEERSHICVDGIIVQVSDPKDKEVRVEFLDESSFKVDIIGLK